MNTTGGYQWGHLRGCLPPSPRPRGGQVCRPSAFSLIQERQLTSDPWGPRPLQAQSFSWRLVSSPVPFQKSRFCFLHHQIIKDRASPVAQWLRTCLPMQETQVQSLGQEDPTCLGATKPVCHYWAGEPQLLNVSAPEPALHSRRCPAMRSLASHSTSKTQHKDKIHSYKWVFKKADPTFTKGSNIFFFNSNG